MSRRLTTQAAPSVSADDVLRERKKYKETKKSYNVAVAAAATLPTPKPPRKKRDPTLPKSAGTIANTDRFAQQSKLAKEIRATDPSMKWQDAVRKAAEQLKQPVAAAVAATPDAETA